MDADGDLSIVQSKKNQNAGYFSYVKNFTYTAAGAVSSMQLGNGKWESTVFNSRLQPTQIALGTVQNGTDTLKLNYDYGATNNNGNVLSQQITVPTAGNAAGFTAIQNYTYDSLNRLKSATETISSGQSWKQTFVYDRYGNRNFDTNNTTTIPAGSLPKVVNPEVLTSSNRFKSDQDGDGVNDYLYDASGSVTKDAQGRTFTYDGENKQTKVVSSGQTVGEYFYDGDGKRVKKYVPSTSETTVFVYDAASKLVAEYSNQLSATPQVSYLTADHLGSPRLTTDANGAVTSRRDFQPFGEETFTAQRTQGLGYTVDNVRQKFTSYERDTESSLDFAQARMYGYSHGRFTSIDPITMTKSRLADPQAINLYVYTRNNPLKYIDPDGEEFKGTDGKRVEIEERDGQLVITSKNATKDLINLVGLINGTGSSTALSQFNRLNAHKTMVNLVIDTTSLDRKDRTGLHQPHGTKPDGTKGALEFKDGKFQGQADIVKDANGNEVYAEATITLFEGVYNFYNKDNVQATEDGLVSTFGHEAEHDLDLNQVQETKRNTGNDAIYHPRNPNGPVKGSPYWMSAQITKEIQESRRRPKCPTGHMCF